ncbi:MAG: multicopper oxidase domain-containing protein, partial [Burkholderiales bacterium]
EPPPVASDGAFEVMRFVVDKGRTAAVGALPGRIAAAAPAPDLGPPVRRRRFTLDMHGPMMGGMGGMRGGMGGMRGGMRGPMGGGLGMMGMGINGHAHAMQRIDQHVRRGDTELWEVLANNMAHPFHVHATSFRVLRLNGRPVPFPEMGWKDTVLVNGTAELLVRFAHQADERAPYMFHCHILEHEDAGMMGQFTVA